jgi:hypothetical protein
MQEFALFAVLLKERPYKNPYIADGRRQELVEARGRDACATEGLYAGSIRRGAKPGSLPGSAAMSGDTRSGT